MTDSVRDVIAKAAADHWYIEKVEGCDFSSLEDQSDAIIEALHDAGHRILGPGELDPYTLRRCTQRVEDRIATIEAVAARHNDPGINFILSISAARREAKDIAAAIRAMEKTDAE